MAGDSAEDAVSRSGDDPMTAAKMSDWDEGSILYGEVHPSGVCRECGSDDIVFDGLPPLGSDERPYDRGREES